MWDLFFCDSYELKVVRKWEIWKKGKFRLFFPFRPFFCLPSRYPVSRLSGCVWPQVQGIWGNQQSWFTMIFVWTVFLGERSNKKQENKTFCSLCFPVLPFTSRNVHQPVFFLFFFFYIRGPACVNSITISLFLPLWDIWTAVAECVYYRGCDPDILFNTWPLSA